jgi:hypothetical protein
MPAGRPTKYRATYATQAKKLCKLGATDRELADFFQVDVVTLNAWKTRYPRFLKSLKLGKESADARVEQSLYHRAMGYSHPDVHVSNYQGEITVTPLVKHYAPDPVACIFWLKNRRPDLWRDKVDHSLTGKDGGPIIIKAAPLDDQL